MLSVPAARAPIIEGENTVSREWFRFFSSIFSLLKGGVTGSFISADGKTIAVVNGIITSIT